MLCAPEDIIAVLEEIEERVSKRSKGSYGSYASTKHLDNLRKIADLVVPQIFKITAFGFHADAIVKYFYNTLGLLRSDIGKPTIVLDHAINVIANTLRNAS